MRALLIQNGNRHAVYALGSRTRCDVREMVERLFVDDRKTAERFLATVTRFSRGEETYHGSIKSLKGGHAKGLYEFRCNSLRVLWFYDADDGRAVLCTHAFMKKSQETPKGEIKKAQDLLHAYQAAKISGDIEFTES